MKTHRWKSTARSWAGVIAAFLVVAAAVWLLAVHIHARYVTPRDKVTVDT